MSNKVPPDKDVKELLDGLKDLGVLDEMFKLLNPYLRRISEQKPIRPKIPAKEKDRIRKEFAEAEKAVSEINDSVSDEKRLRRWEALRNSLDQMALLNEPDKWAEDPLKPQIYQPWNVYEWEQKYQDLKNKIKIEKERLKDPFSLHTKKRKRYLENLQDDLKEHEKGRFDQSFKEEMDLIIVNLCNVIYGKLAKDIDVVDRWGLAQRTYELVNKFVTFYSEGSFPNYQCPSVGAIRKIFERSNQFVALKIEEENDI